MISIRRFVCLSVLLLLLSSRVDAEVVAVVNGTEITSNQVDGYMLSRKIPKSLWPSVRKQMLEQVIDRTLIGAFLKERKIEGDSRTIDKLVAEMKKKISDGGENPADVFAKLGLSEEKLRAEIGLPLAWQAYVRSILTADDFADYYNERRAELDGTEIRARQILVKVAKDADESAVDRAKSQLANLRMQIVDGKLDFADAAKKYSQAPSGRNGGDVGLFPFEGVMPVDFARVAFRLKEDAISEPVRTSVGLHLIQVTERKPGDLSLEDVRPEIFRKLTAAKWKKEVAAERKSSLIRIVE